MRRPARRWRWLLGGLIFASIGIFWGVPLIGEQYIRRRVVPGLAQRYGVSIAVGDVELGWTEARLHNVVVTGREATQVEGPAPLRLELAVMALAPWRSLRQPIRHVTLHGLAVSIARDQQGALNLPLRSGQDATTTRSHHERIARPPIRVVDGNVNFTDAITRINLQSGSLRGEIEQGHIQVALTDVRVTLPLGTAFRAAAVTLDRPANAQLVATLQGGAVALWEGLSLSGIRGTVQPAATGNGYVLAATGGYGGADVTLWSAEGTLDPVAETGKMKLVAERFSLAKLAPVLQNTTLVRIDDTTVDATLFVEGTKKQVSLQGRVDVEHLSFAHPKLAEKPIENLSLGLDVIASVDVPARRVEFRPLTIRAAKAQAQMTGWIAGPSPHSVPPRSAKALDLRIVVPPTPCAAVLAAVPAALAPALMDYRLRGTFSSDIQVAADWANLDATVLGGVVGIDGCKVAVAPPTIERMATEFAHAVEVEKDVWQTIVIGPSNPEFVALADISPHLRNAILSTEDPSFFRHKGFLPSEFREALVKNLQAGRFKFGASSITMQFVKNTLLSRDKTIARKFQELFLTWRVEQVLEKERIYEIYLNAIEFGPGIYGVGPAAQHYFGKHAGLLTPEEGAFLASIVPSPKLRYKQYCNGAPSAWTQAKIGRILDRMKSKGWLTDEEAALAKTTPVVFVRAPNDTTDTCLARRKKAIERARPTDQPDDFADENESQ